ncbi:O-antigen ligase family protein [Candidatus Methylobacter oryzae]|uniref:O-antigen ligase family protein n=1 Tax=Candidatus Methylobacter oryzae TaxID=2497749 RepID=A0ABY3C9X1_9GAMM|nr:O-antigen ligase family protein [Candidatus Methylobacter oryzae]TRW91217.1 O-antigen ligase family protein [Candidatus Methylobacter oryzae]
MILRFEKDLPMLLFALVGASTLASLPQVESAWTGVKEVYGEQDFGLRILRELMLLVLVAYAFFEPRLRNGALSSRVLAFLGAVATYVLFEVGYALYLDLPFVVPMAGLRVFEYLPLALIGFVTSRLGAGDYILNRFAHYLRYYIAVQAVLAIAQALWAPPLFGVSFLGGGRPFGTFVSPNLFGATMATCALLFSLVPAMGKWVAVSVFLALLSGSRTAFISALLVVYFQVYARLRPRDRWALVMPAPVLAVGALVLASSPLLSGRNDADPTEDGRIALWQRVFSEQVHGPADVLFGWGLGLSSNTINILYGAEHFPGQFDSDSLYLFLLNGYGLIGLLAYLLFLWMTTRTSIHRNKGVVVMFIFVAGLTFNMWEYFPQNAMLMYLWGMVLGTGLQREASPLPIFRPSRF